MSSDMVLLGEIVRPHGVKGEVKLRSFTADPCAIGAYGELVTERGERVTLKNVRAAHDHVIARIAGVDDRDAAERLKGRKLQVARDALPETGEDDEIYAADLVGLAAIAQDGRTLGEIVAVQDFGAGDLLELAVPGTKRTVLLPFTDDVVVEIAEDRVIVDASDGSVASAFLAPVGETPQELEAANDNPPIESGEAT
jgi:16S rRNA processing protein RimM